MSKASQSMQNLARQLFAIEVSQANDGDLGVKPLDKVCERLRGPLTKFAGPVGYSSLLSRAFALAQVERPKPNPSEESRESRENAEVEIVAQLLGLLALFIGESLMITLLRDAWPSESFDIADHRSEVKS